MVCLAVTYVVLPNREEEATAPLRPTHRGQPRRAGVPLLPGCTGAPRSRATSSSTSSTSTRRRWPPTAAAPTSRSTCSGGCSGSSRAARPRVWTTLDFPPRTVSAASLTVDLPEAAGRAGGEPALGRRCHRAGDPRPRGAADAGGPGACVRARRCWWPGSSGPAAAEAALGMLQEAMEPLRAAIEEAPDTDWSTAWRARIRSTRVGRLWVGPALGDAAAGRGGPHHRAEDGLRHRRPSHHRALPRRGGRLLHAPLRAPRCSTWGPGPACWR